METYKSSRSSQGLAGISGGKTVSINNMNITSAGGLQAAMCLPLLHCSCPVRPTQMAHFADEFTEANLPKPVL